MAETKKQKKELPIGAVISDPGSTEKYYTGTWRAFRPVIDYSKCIKCQACWRACPDAAVKEKEDGTIYIDYNYCKGCLVCIKECPVKAISKEAEQK
jgi:pyruvate ferredoxin oxidoreductase delta subunit